MIFQINTTTLLHDFQTNTTNLRSRRESDATRANHKVNLEVSGALALTAMSNDSCELQLF